jgi:predicted transcriptional regulator
MGFRMARRKKTLRRWSAADVKLLKSLAGKKTVRQIAGKLKRSEAAVRYKAWSKRLRLTSR